MAIKDSNQKIESARLFLNAFEMSVSTIPASHFGHYEKVYTYELYRQLYNLIEKHKNRYPGNVFLHGEAVKLSRIGMGLGLFNLPKNKRFDPDLVFHTPDNSNNQIAIVEIKVRGLGKTTLLRDLEKLTIFKKNANFEAVIFHCINYSKEDLQKRLKKASSEQTETLDGKIVIFTRKNLDTEVERFALSEILQTDHN